MAQKLYKKQKKSAWEELFSSSLEVEEDETKYDLFPTDKQREDKDKEVARIQKGGAKAITLFLKAPKLVEKYTNAQLELEYIVAVDLASLYPDNTKLQAYRRALKKIVDDRELSISIQLEKMEKEEKK